MSAKDENATARSGGINRGSTLKTAYRDLANQFLRTTYGDITLI
jgi:hypothetical protein